MVYAASCIRPSGVARYLLKNCVPFHLSHTPVFRSIFLSVDSFLPYHSRIFTCVPMLQRTDGAGRKCGWSTRVARWKDKSNSTARQEPGVRGWPRQAGGMGQAGKMDLSKTTTPIWFPPSPPCLFVILFCLTSCPSLVPLAGQSVLGGPKGGAHMVIKKWVVIFPISVIEGIKEEKKTLLLY